MFEKFCPNTHSLCRNGFPGYEDHICIFWDEIREDCLFADSVRFSSLQLHRTKAILEEIARDQERRKDELWSDNVERRIQVILKREDKAGDLPNE